MKSLRLLLRQAREIRDQVCDVWIRELVHLRARHHAHVALVTGLDDLRDVLRRDGIVVHQLRMRRIVEDLAEPGPDLLLIERPDRVARAALLPEQLLPEVDLALSDRDRAATAAARRPALAGEPLRE